MNLLDLHKIQTVIVVVLEGCVNEVLRFVIREGKDISDIADFDLSEGNRVVIGEIWRN